MTETTAPIFKTMAEALIYYQKQGHSVEDAIKEVHKHTNLLKKWTERMEKMSYEME